MGDTIARISATTFRTLRTRGVLYVVWGDRPQTRKALDRSIGSLTRVHPELPCHVERLPNGTLLDKARMFDLSPYEETLFLDADTVVMDRLDFGFDMAGRHGLACCICECPWARRYGGLKERGDMIEYNTGVLFFGRTAKPLFDRWRDLTGIDSSITFVRDGKTLRMPRNDQASFALAVQDTHCNPFVLPMNWNLRPIWYRHLFGPVKIWHDYSEVPVAVEDWNARQLREGAIIDYAKLA